MCGIVGYIGTKNVKEVLLDGLKELEYRGYDSAGIAVMREKRIDAFKAVGKLVNLEEKTADFQPEGFALGIGHTRWATHGKPTELNAHPHRGEFSHVVHNGIIENHNGLKAMLQKEGFSFVSQTDTEVIVHLFEQKLRSAGSVFQAFTATIHELEGAYAILLVTTDDPETIYFAKKGSPLVMGMEGDEAFIASSDAPLVGRCAEAVFLEDGEYGTVTKEGIKLFREGKEAAPGFRPISHSKQSAQKEGYRFFMEKEIYEQSQVMAETLLGRVGKDRVAFDEVPEGFLEGIDEITVCACGTSYHAALSAGYLFERLGKIKANTVIASEFRYKEPLLRKGELFVVISQSGETADTLEALKMAKTAGLKTLAVCNVDNSSIVRTADATILTRAGIEKGVASTKAFATQMMVLWMLALKIGQEKNVLAPETLAAELDALRHAHRAAVVSEGMHETIHRFSKRYLHGHGFFFIGRDLFYPLALEGALKLKEISYLHAEGYPAGEMKHGPIALADAELFTLALMPGTLLYEKVKSNVEELSARDSTILAVTPIPFDKADDLLQTESWEHPMLEFFQMMVILQLFAMEIAIRLGNDVDMPRNLAKSVTVE